jgi:hypothetical protein
MSYLYETSLCSCEQRQNFRAAKKKPMTTNSRGRQSKLHSFLFKIPSYNFCCLTHKYSQDVLKHVYEVVSESSQALIIVTASVKEDERGGQGHTFASLVHQYLT